MSGWICSYRKIWDHPIFRGNAERVGVWTWMLHTAVWKDSRFAIGTTIIDLKRGQLCISTRQVSEETGMGRQALRTFLALLESEGAITQKVTGTATQRRTVVTICKYEEYQAPADTKNPKSNPQATRRQPSKEQGNNKTNPSIEGDAAAPPSAQVVEVSVLSKAVWDCKPFLESRGVSNPGSIIGRWLKAHPPVAVLTAIEAAQKSGTQDPIPYITETLKGGQHDQSPRKAKSQRHMDAFIAGARGTG